MTSSISVERVRESLESPLSNVPLDVSIYLIDLASRALSPAGSDLVERLGAKAIEWEGIGARHPAYKDEALIAALREAATALSSPPVWSAGREEIARVASEKMREAFLAVFKKAGTGSMIMHEERGPPGIAFGVPRGDVLDAVDAAVAAAADAVLALLALPAREAGKREVIKGEVGREFPNEEKP